MAIPKRGSRRILVDGKEYRWYIRRKQKYWQEFGEFGTGLAVEIAEGQGSLLIVQVPRFFPTIECLPDETLVPVVPGDVAQYIRLARKAGWNSDVAGDTFHLSADSIINA